MLFIALWSVFNVLPIALWSVFSVLFIVMWSVFSVLIIAQWSVFSVLSIALWSAFSVLFIAQWSVFSVLFIIQCSAFSVFKAHFLFPTDRINSIVYLTLTSLSRMFTLQLLDKEYLFICLHFKFNDHFAVVRSRLLCSPVFSFRNHLYSNRHLKPTLYGHVICVKFMWLMVVLSVSQCYRLGTVTHFATVTD